jgi:hypothetical protein
VSVLLRRDLSALGKGQQASPRPSLSNVQVYRYRCCSCHRTFRDYPEGVDRADQTQRLRKLAAIYWVLGMSLRATQIALSAFGIKISPMTVWRDLQEQAEQLGGRRRWQPVRVLEVSQRII